MIRWNQIQICLVGEREFFGSESGDDMKISHAVSKADSDEENNSHRRYACRCR